MTAQCFNNVCQPRLEELSNINLSPQISHDIFQCLQLQKTGTQIKNTYKQVQHLQKNNSLVCGNSNVNKRTRNFSASKYKKNICGHILKKAFRELIDIDYKQIIMKFCSDYQISYQYMAKYYSARLQRVTGPSHIQEFLISYKGEEDIKCSKVFLSFSKYFLSERYLRYMVGEGRMDHKRVYVEYKNRKLLPILHMIEQKLNSKASERHQAIFRQQN